MNSSPMNTATAAGAAAVVAPLVSWIAALCHLTLTPEVLSSIVVLIVAGAHWVGNVVAARTAPAAAPAAPAQAGFVSPAMLWMSAALAVAVCFAGCTTPPTATQQTQIRMACAADVGIRPSIDVLRAIPGFATPAEETAILTARSIIDPICANPAGPFTVADPYVAVTQASATVAGVLVQMEARKAGK